MAISLTEAQREKLYDLVDESAYSLEDWQAALATFEQWLSDRGIAARPVESMLGYIHFCTMTSAPTLARPNFAGLVSDMLDEHGFDAAGDVSTESG